MVGVDLQGHPSPAVAGMTVLDMAVSSVEKKSKTISILYKQVQLKFIRLYLSYC